MRVLVTRPAQDAAAFARRLAACGVEPVAAPLMTVAFDPGLALDLAGVQAVLLTSANGARALAAATQVRGLAVFAVGPATAAAATEAGFRDVDVAGGDVAQLAEAVRKRLTPEAGTLLNLAGSVAAGDLAGVLAEAGFDVRRVTGYRAEPVARLPDAATRSLRDGLLDGAVFFSPRTAETFVRLVREAGLDRHLGPVTAYCLSRPVADRLGGLVWRGLEVTPQPDGEALADLICAHGARHREASGSGAQRGGKAMGRRAEGP